MRNRALKTVEEIISTHENSCFIGSDLGFGTLGGLREKYPNRVLMEGIAEQHIVGFAAGLSASGYFPIVHTIATFLTRRSFEQIAIDFSLQHLPGMFLGAGGGMVYAPLGPTHQAIDDFALMSSIPNLNVYAPADPIEIQELMTKSVKNLELAYFRVGRGGEPDITTEFHSTQNGNLKYVKSGNDFVLITTGTLLHEALNAYKSLSSMGINGTVIHLPKLNLVAALDLVNLISDSKLVLVIEEHIPIGGLYSHCIQSGLGALVDSKFIHLSLPLSYASNYGSQAAHRAKNQIDSEGIVNRINVELRNRGN